MAKVTHAPLPVWTYMKISPCICLLRVVPNSRQPAELTGYLGRLCQLLSWYICIFKDKLFVPLLAQIYENETYFPLQFIDLKIICLAQRYTIISSLRWVLGIACRKPLKALVYTNKIEKLWLLLELTLLEIGAQNQGNSISGDLKCKNFLGGGACSQTPPRRDHLRRSIITIRLLYQLLEKLWTTLLLLVKQPWSSSLWFTLLLS